MLFKTLNEVKRRAYKIKMTIFYGFNNYEIRLAVKKENDESVSSHLQSNTVQDKEIKDCMNWPQLLR